MPRRGERRPKPVVGDPTDRDGMAATVGEFLMRMRTKNYSERTVGNRELHLTGLIQWLEDRGVTRPAEVTRPMLERYQRWLYHYRKRDGHPISFMAQHGRLTSIRAYFRWLAKANRILYNPASELELPKVEKRLPRHVLTAEEAELVLHQPDPRTLMGLRDRAILEVFYSTGVRRMELAGLSLYDLDQERGTLMVRQGKGKKDRTVPVGERAGAWLRKYLEEARPQLVVEPDTGALFLNKDGEPFLLDRLTGLVRGYVDAAELAKHGSCHMFRHTMATLMLEGGADIRYIQQMLGHAELSTTQVYTQVSIRKLQEVHALTHPAARLRPRRLGEQLAPDEAPVDPYELPATEEQLLLSLAAEAAEESPPDPDELPLPLASA